MPVPTASAKPIEMSRCSTHRSPPLTAMHTAASQRDSYGTLLKSLASLRRWVTRPRTARRGRGKPSSSAYLQTNGAPVFPARASATCSGPSVAEASSLLVREHEGPRRRKHPAHAVHQRHVALRHLAGVALATKLARRLDDGEDPVHPGVRVGEPAAVGIDGERAARRGPAVLEEGHALSRFAEAQRLQHD